MAKIYRVSPATHGWPQKTSVAMVSVTMQLMYNLHVPNLVTSGRSPDKEASVNHSNMLVRILLCVCAIAICRGQDGPIISLPQGSIQGKIQITSMGDTVQFLGIPYATPPIGELRFKPATPHGGWNGVLDTSVFGPSCVQNPFPLYYTGASPQEITSLRFHEDCLFANVYLPGNSVNPHAKRSVIVFIHGGKFMFGTSNFIGSMSRVRPEALVITHDVIVVTINFRLNVFGFFTTGDETAPANNGLRDQQLALKWIRNNMPLFGGDVTKLTIVGEETGGESVSLHVLSPSSAGLFQRAVSMSGLATSYHLHQSDESGVALFWSELKTTVQCNAGSSADQLACLRALSAQDLLMGIATGHPPTLIVDGPGGVLPDQPSALLDRGLFNPVDYIIGYNSEDGDLGIFFSPDQNEIVKYGLSQDHVVFDNAFDWLQIFGFPSNREPLGRDVMMYATSFYIRDPSNHLYNLRDILDLLRDSFYRAPAYRAANALSTAGANVYFYHFDHVAPSSAKKYENASIPMRAGSGTGLWYIVGDPDMTNNGDTPEADVKVAFSFMNALASFAKTGEPKLLNTDTNAEIDWPTFDPFTTTFADITTHISTASIKSNLGPQMAVLWNSLLPEVIRSAKTDNIGKQALSHGQEPEVDDPEDGGSPESEEGDGVGDPIPEAEDIQEITTYVILALVALIFIFMLVITIMVCNIKKATLRQSGYAQHSKPGSAPM